MAVGDADLLQWVMQKLFLGYVWQLTVLKYVFKNNIPVHYPIGYQIKFHLPFNP